LANRLWIGSVSRRTPAALMRARHVVFGDPSIEIGLLLSDAAIHLLAERHAIEPVELEQARTVQARPPMPWYDVARMIDADPRAIYDFVRHLGPAGSEAPQALPPAAPPPPPFVDFPAPPPGTK
jgi:hypothetical protein